MTRVVINLTTDTHEFIQLYLYNTFNSVDLCHMQPAGTISRIKLGKPLKSDSCQKFPLTNVWLCIPRTSVVDSRGAVGAVSISHSGLTVIKTRAQDWGHSAAWHECTGCAWL